MVESFEARRGGSGFPFVLPDRARRLLVVFDAGLHRDVRDERSPRYGLLSPDFDCDLPAGTALDERLTACGIDPADVDFLVLSHLHFDHVGGSDVLPGAEVVLQAREWGAALADTAGENYLAADVTGVGRPQLLDGERDLLGDGRLRLLPTVGHTAGHQSLSSQQTPVASMLCGDACYTRRSLEDVALATFGNGLDAQRLVLEELGRSSQAVPNWSSVTILPNGPPARPTTRSWSWVACDSRNRSQPHGSATCGIPPRAGVVLYLTPGSGRSREHSGEPGLKTAALALRPAGSRLSSGVGCVLRSMEGGPGSGWHHQRRDRRHGRRNAWHGSSCPDQLEVKGIEHIGQAERWGKPSNLFWLWAGAVWNVEYVVYGTLIVVIFGLDFAQAVPVIILGNLFYFLTGFASLQGPVAGTTAFAISRAPFGPNGNRVPSLFNWITQVGFEIEGIALIVLAGVALAAKAGISAGDGLKAALIIGACLLQALLPFIGHAAMVKVLRWLSLPFVVLFAIMAAITAGKVHLNAAAHGAGWGSVMVALALVIAAGGLGWTKNGNDYSRYLPATSSKRNIVLAGRARGRHTLRPPRDPRSGGGNRRHAWFGGIVRDHLGQRARRGLPGLVRRALPHRRHHAAVRHQQHGPLFVRCDAAEHWPAPQAIPLCADRHGRGRRVHVLRHLLLTLQPAARGLPSLHHRLGGALVRHLPDRLSDQRRAV